MSINSDRFAIIPIHADSAGNEAVPGNAIFVGSRSAVMERILDSKARRESLTLINDAEHVRKEKRAVAAQRKEVDTQRKEVDARADAVSQAEDVIRQLCGMIDSFGRRLDSYEETQRAKADAEDPENQITLPPNEHTLLDPVLSDEGELQATKKAPYHPQYEDPDTPHTEFEGDDQGDPGAVLPRASIPLPNKYYDPHPPPESKLNLATWKES
jgi:hypothetical protein